MDLTRRDPLAERPQAMDVGRRLVDTAVSAGGKCSFHGSFMKVLVVEDESVFAADLQKTLKNGGFTADCVGLIDDAKMALIDTEYDLIVLDRLLPDGDGTELIGWLEQKSITRPPILLLTALGGIPNRVEGLDAGADDYLAKPMNDDEFLARARALVRRPQLKDRTVLSFQNVAFNCHHREVRVDDAVVPLSRIELAILEALMLRTDRVVLRERLESSVYGFDDEFASNTLDSQISRLRKKLAAANANVQIKVTRGVGYRITAA